MSQSNEEQLVVADLYVGEDSQTHRGIIVEEVINGGDVEYKCIFTGRTSQIEGQVTPISSYLPDYLLSPTIPKTSLKEANTTILKVYADFQRVAKSRKRLDDAIETFGFY